MVAGTYDILLFLRLHLCKDLRDVKQFLKSVS